MSYLRFTIPASIALFVAAAVLVQAGEVFNVYAGLLLILSGAGTFLWRALLVGKARVASNVKVQKFELLLASSASWTWGAGIIVLGVVLLATH